MTTPVEKSFKIDVSDQQITELQQKLALAILPDELEDADRDYGVPLSDIKRLVSRWKGGYDWRKHEAQLNEEIPQFTREIEVDDFGTLEVHYAHKKSSVDGAIPLLFVHGWPGSFIEVRKILPLLTASTAEHPGFHVVALSLPGYGFSSAPTKKGFKLNQYAEVGNKLMVSLGYDEYVTQGGDWGFYITRRIAKLYGGTHSKAWHTNFPHNRETPAPPSFFTEPFLFISDLFSQYTPAEKASLQRAAWFQTKGRGYSVEQSTQPQTLGYGLADSPIGLLAWIYEKLVNWSDAYPWDDDEVLTWVSIYWFSKAGPAASLRIYYETIQGKDHGVEATTIPMGYSYFPQEIYNLPRRWLRVPNLVFEAEHDSGGHFAAHEKPELLVDDLRKMFGRGGPAFGVVTGKSGYA